MSFTQKHLQVDFSLSTGNFQGGGNSYSAKGLRITADIVKAGGISLGGANLVIYGLPLSVMNQLSTFGNVLTDQGRNSVTVSAWEDGAISDGGVSGRHLHPPSWTANLSLTSVSTSKPMSASTPRPSRSSPHLSRGHRMWPRS